MGPGKGLLLSSYQALGLATLPVILLTGTTVSQAIVVKCSFCVEVVHPVSPPGIGKMFSREKKQDVEWKIL